MASTAEKGDNLDEAKLALEWVARNFERLWD
jgi:hypothetical protein